MADHDETRQAREPGDTEARTADGPTQRDAGATEARTRRDDVGTQAESGLETNPEEGLRVSQAGSQGHGPLRANPENINPRAPEEDRRVP